MENKTVEMVVNNLLLADNRKKKTVLIMASVKCTKKSLKRKRVA